MTRRRNSLSLPIECRLWLTALTVLMFAVPSWSSAEVDFQTSTSRVTLDDAAPARQFNVPPLVIGLDLVDGVVPSVRCVAQAGKGSKFEILGQLFDGDGEFLAELSQTGKTKGSTYSRPLVWHFNDPLNGGGDQDATDTIPGLDLLFAASLSGRNGKEIEEASLTCTAGVVSDCVADATTACLDKQRFQVAAEWMDPFDGSQRAALVQEVTSDRVVFFLSPTQTQVLVEVLNGCQITDHFWVFYAATTNVAFDVTVTDTLTGHSRTYSDDAGLGTPFQPIQDTQAFTTCP